MSNVIQFTARPRPEAEPAPKIEYEATAATQQPNSAAMAVVAALSFYAAQGFDHGVKARMALESMQVVVEGVESGDQA